MYQNNVCTDTLCSVFVFSYRAKTMNTPSQIIKVPRKVILPLVWADHTARTMLTGLFSFFHEKEDWEFLRIPCTPEAIQNVAKRNPDGMIGRFPETDCIQAALDLDIPLVNVSGAAVRLGMAQVGEDNRAIGRMAAEHFIEEGFEHFGYHGLAGETSSRERWEGFKQRVEAEGLKAHRFECGEKTPWADTAEWLAALPRPVGILGLTDSQAVYVHKTCRNLNLVVPDDVAILGVGDDPIYCFSTTPRLSSIQLPAFQMGYEAARILDRLFAGKPIAKKPLLLPPKGVAVRRSTDFLQFEDVCLKKAVCYIRDHCGDEMTVEQVVRQSGVSRRLLEMKFRAQLGRSPQLEIRRVRIEKAKELLSGTQLSFQDIAGRAGLKTASYLCQAFKTVTGTSPGAYRRQFQHE